ncbi:MAG TPA: flagellar basal body-associated FliL family protein [Rhodocyclaceae bacterium]
MAEKKSEAEGGEAAAKPKGKLLLFIIIGVLVLVLGGAGAYFALKKKPAAEDDEADDGGARTEKVHKAKKDHPDAPPVFVKFDPFTVKLQSDPQQETYVQATTELQVIDAPAGERVKQYSPAIRHRVLLILSGKKPSDISTPQGVQRLSNEIRDAINVIIDGPKTKAKGKGGEEAAAEPSDTAAADDSVQAVLFTQFIIQ